MSDENFREMACQNFFIFCKCCLEIVLEFRIPSISNPATTNSSTDMKRRSFMKKSVAAAIVAATPLALTGLVNAAGVGGGTNTETGTGTWAETTGWFDTTIMETTVSFCGEYTISHPNDYKSFRYEKQVGNEKHMFCYQEYRCPGLDSNGNPITTYCFRAFGANGEVESDCGKATLGKTGNSNCDPNGRKKPGDPWP